MSYDPDARWSRLADIQSMLWLHDTRSSYLLSDIDTGLLQMRHLRQPNGDPVYDVAKHRAGKRHLNVFSLEISFNTNIRM